MLREKHILAECLVVAFLLAVYSVLAASSGLRKSPVFDEVPHLTAGVSHWRTGDYRLNPEQGALPQRWAALPVAFGPFGFPSTDQEAWRLSDEWELGDQLFHRLGNDLGSMLFRARSMVTLLGVLLGLTVYLWSRRLFGRRGALISLVLFCFSPTMLAHGRFVTSDLTLALTLTVAVGAWWIMLRRLTWVTVLGSAAATGLLFLSKASAAIIVPMFVAMGVVRALRTVRWTPHPG
ncbi:ArnT family glycosyltransferase, partial [Verrucomicrobiota bacterium]